METVSLHIPEASSDYVVHINRGILDQVGEMVRAVAPHRLAAVVVDQAIRESHGERVVESLNHAGYGVMVCGLESSESSKTLDSAKLLYDALLQIPMERSSPVIAVGGGVVGDTAGYVAATFLRGVPFINIPTTLLSMVDASVGGKTGVNIELPTGGLGKNLVGAFHQPSAVMIDVEALQTLPGRHIRAGMAECIKHAVIADESLLEWIARDGSTFAQWPPVDQARFIARNVAIKAGIVERDAKEKRLRMQLNLGHTFAHAIETRDDLDLLHGEAVALGLVAAAAASVASERADDVVLDRIESTLTSVGLPTRLSTLPNDETLLESMRHDKKVSHGRFRLVLPTRIGKVEIADDLPAEIVAAGWARVREN